MISIRGRSVPPAMQREMTLQYRRGLYLEAVALIRREYATDLSVDDVARRLFCSRRQLQRVFFEAGTTFRVVCRRTRMAVACHLLRARPGMTVAEVSRAVGYQEPSQFAKAFRREVGVAPARFRRAAAPRGSAGYEPQRTGTPRSPSQLAPV